QPNALGPLGPLAGLLRLKIIHRSRALDPLGPLEPSWTASLASVLSRSKITTCSSMLACSGPLGPLCAHTQVKKIVEKCANWAHQSAIHFGKMRMEGCSEFISSAQVLVRGARRDDLGVNGLRE